MLSAKSLTFIYRELPEYIETSSIFYVPVLSVASNLLNKDRINNYDSYTTGTRQDLPLASPLPNGKEALTRLNTD